MNSPANLTVHKFINQLSPGNIVDLQLGSSKLVRIKPVVIGIDIGNYLILKFPPRLNIKDYQDVLIDGTGVIVRYILEGQHGECVAFSTTIKQFINAPDKLIFLNYPSRIENRQLRSHQREKTHLPAQISPHMADGQLTGNCINGYIVDISARGCQFSFKAEKDNVGMVKRPVYIAITLVGVNKPLIVKAHVKNNRLEHGQTLVGIMFDESSLEQISNLLDDMSFSSD
ncbi:MAG: flagellar brake domain-containing protein [Pseudomonadales bacterium]